MYVPVMLALFLWWLTGLWWTTGELRRREYLAMWLGAMVVWAISQWWTFQVASLGFFPLIAIQSGWLVLLAWSAKRVHAAFGWRVMALLFPVLWTGVEFLRAEVFMGGYAWGLTSQGMINSSFAYIAPLAGVYGVTLAVTALASLFVFVILKYKERVVAKGHKVVLPGIVYLLLGYLALMFLVTQAPAPVETPSKFRVASVQTNIPQSNKTYWTLEAEVRDYRRMQRLSEQAAERTPSLIIWPETMMPGISIEPSAVAAMEAKGLVFTLKEAMPEELGTDEKRIKATAFWEALSEHSRRTGVPMLIGEEGLEGFEVDVDAQGRVEWTQKARYNSAYLVRNGAVSGDRYDKMELTPFGEYMPVISRFPWLEQKLLGLAAAGMRFDLSPGTRKTVFRVPGGEGDVRVVTPICFEITESTVCRALAFADGVRRADVLVNMSNDGWFQGSDAAREQHLRISQWRAMELGTPVVRSANTGISAVIDAHGRIVARGVDGNAEGTRAEGVLIADVPLPSQEATFYARTGNWLGWGCLGAWAALTLGAVVRLRRHQKPA